MDKPFWEQTYANPSVSTFSKGPTADIAEFWNLFPEGATVLDVGCGEGRNAIFLAEKGFVVDAFDISWTGLEKAKSLAADKGVDVNFFREDVAKYDFKKKMYDIVLSHGVFHLCKKHDRDRFIELSKQHTNPGGFHAICIFTNRLPATPDMAPFTKSLFDVGELPGFYTDWDIVQHWEEIFEDSHPGGIHHQHARERIIAKKAD